jgi:protein-S-isoprenylcysteine O-methyltransferase Ste14
MKRRLKVNGFIMFCAFLLIAAFPATFLRKEHASFGVFNQALEICGIAFILLGQLLRISGRGYKSEHSGNGHFLIRSGPYSLVRNPMYLGILLIGFGVVLLLFEWWAIGIFLSVFIIRYLLLIFKEEKKLLKMFPDEYPAYQKNVPRIMPSLNKILTSDINTYLPLRLSWVKREIGSVLALLFIALLVESWEDIKKKGLANYLKEAAAYLAVIILFICLAVYLSRRSERLSSDVSGKSQGN